jgi:antitoxin component of MazEF toxin-antitoxin module
MTSSKVLELEYRKVYDMAHGLSTGICLPKHYTRNLGIKSGDFVKISQVDQRIVIEKAQQT